MKTKKDVNLLSYIKTERHCLMFGRFYPIRDEQLRIQRTLSAVLFMTIACMYNILGLVYAFQHVSNVTVFSEILAYLLTGISFLCKILNILFQKKKLLLLDDLLQNPVLTKLETIEEERIVKNKLKFSQTLKKVYKIYVVITVAVQIIYPLINNTDHKNFPILLWFPFNPEQHYYKVYCLEVLMIVCCYFFNTTIDLLNVLFMDLCVAQFELLKHRLINFGSTAREKPKDNKVLFQQMRKMVIHQNYVYRCSELVDEIFSVGVFCQLASTAIVLCFGIFKAVVTPFRSMQFLMMATYLFSMTLEISLYCCYGQKVLNASNTVTDACFMSKWHNCSLKVQKQLVIVMYRTNKSVILRACRLFPLTLETLMSIWNSSYTFFTLLMQIYSKND